MKRMRTRTYIIDTNHKEIAAKKDALKKLLIINSTYIIYIQKLNKLKKKQNYVY